MEQTLTRRQYILPCLLSLVLSLLLALSLTGCSAPAQEPDEGLELFSHQLVEDENGSHYVILGLAEGVDPAEITDLVIPGESSKHQIPVTELASAAFQGSEHLRSVTLPPSVTKLGSDTFSDCPGLDRLYFPGRADLTGLSPYPAGQLGGKWFLFELEDSVALRRSLNHPGAEYISSDWGERANQSIINMFELPHGPSATDEEDYPEYMERFYQEMTPYYIEGDLKTIEEYIYEYWPAV